RGMQYSDDPKGPVGANCYACHQLAPQELSYGTIGPSLYQFGKLRGYGVEAQKYAYGKVYNPEADSACTNMPRFGHNGILTEAQGGEGAGGVFGGRAAGEEGLERAGGVAWWRAGGDGWGGGARARGTGGKARADGGRLLGVDVSADYGKLTL